MLLAMLVKAHIHQEDYISKVRSELLMLSRRFNEKIPTKLLYSLRERFSVSRMAEVCASNFKIPSMNDEEQSSLTISY